MCMVALNALSLLFLKGKLPFKTSHVSSSMFFFVNYISTLNT